MLSRPKVLWHSDYWDGMLSGLVLYNNEKVWAHCIETGGYIGGCSSIEHLGEEVKEEFKKQGLSFPIEEEKTYNAKDYEITLLIDVMVHEKRKFKLYRLPSDVLEKMEYNHKLWQQYGGYHCDHDPEVYKPMQGSVNWDLLKEKQIGVNMTNLSELEYLGVFYDSDFDQYSTPR